MYKQYFNEYEKRAEQIRRAAKAVESGKGEVMSILPNKENIEQKHIERQNDKPTKKKIVLERLATDDILLLGLLFLLISNEEKDITLILILGYLFISGL